MPNKDIILKISGEAAYVDAAVDAYAKNSGWTEANGGDKLVYAQELFRNHFESNVNAYTVEQARRQAAEAAAAAVSAANQNITFTVTVE